MHAPILLSKNSFAVVLKANFDRPLALHAINLKVVPAFGIIYCGKQCQSVHVETLAVCVCVLMQFFCVYYMTVLIQLYGCVKRAVLYVFAHVRNMATSHFINYYSLKFNVFF